MTWKSGILLLALLPMTAFSQHDLVLKNNHSGIISGGMRTTISTFNHGNWQDVGTGAGGEFRLQLHDRVNTEWFADYLRSKIGNSGNRQDAHIGLSIMFYPLKDPSYKKLLKPYVVMGWCFDYTKVGENANPNNTYERWSAAIQTGIGNHINLTERFDITVIAQYMFHLGKHLEAHEQEGVFEIHEHGGLNLEGHLLFTVGVNYKIADLW
ncbi:MAG: hypothetical protein QF371_00860 [Flavobacteriales bacterium]|nr:hypothetical protein [Flavobacteriales bacterium]